MKFQEVLRRAKKVDPITRRLAALWHHPVELKYKDIVNLAGNLGADVRSYRWRWDNLWTNILKKAGKGNRWYFSFHDLPSREYDVVAWYFYDCPNWREYVKLWEANAPTGLDKEEVFLAAVLGTFVIGMNGEEEVEKDLKKAGLEVRKSSGKLDFAGVDFMVRKRRNTFISLPKYLSNLSFKDDEFIYLQVKTHGLDTSRGPLNEAIVGNNVYPLQTVYVKGSDIQNQIDDMNNKSTDVDISELELEYLETGEIQ